MGLEKNFLNIYENPTANFLLNGERLNIPPNTVNKEVYLFLPILFNIVLEALASAIARKGNKNIEMKKEKYNCGYWQIA